MNIKPALKYKLKENLKGMGSFYIIIYLIMILSATMVIVKSDVEISNFNGMELSTWVFMFVIGLNSFKADFRLFLQNGISRKSLYVSSILSLGILSAIMVVIDFVNLMILKSISGVGHRNIYEILFNKSLSWTSVADNMICLLWNIVIIFTAAMAGFLITLVFYKMNKFAKTIVGFGVPILLFVGLPIVNVTFLNDALGKFIPKMIGFLLGGANNPAPYNMIVVSAVICIVLAGISYLIARKATIRQQD